MKRLIYTIYYNAKTLPVFFLLFLPAACNQPEDRLEQALQIAGNNRPELEKVLNHYQTDPKDSLKYQAAVFLIENMPGHYSFADTIFFEKYLQVLDSVASGWKGLSYECRDSIYTLIVTQYNAENLSTVADIEYISSDFLIRNIDQAFFVWENYNWANHLSFDGFCEYLLPYKVAEGQQLDNWREYGLRDYHRFLENLKYCASYKNNASEACNIVNENLRQEVFPIIKSTDHTPISRISTLLKIPYGTCDEYSVMALAVLRAKGIPCAIDYTPQWPFRSMGHTWNVFIGKYR